MRQSLTYGVCFCIKDHMKRITIILLALLILLSSCSSASGYQIYNQGRWENLERGDIEKLISTEPQGFPVLGKNWAYDSLNSALYFTSDLIGLKPDEKIDLLASGKGITVLGEDHQLLAYYEGEETSPGSQTTSVKLIVQNKGVWVIELSRLWEKGPWLVTGLKKSK